MGPQTDDVGAEYLFAAEPDCIQPEWRGLEQSGYNQISVRIDQREPCCAPFEVAYVLHTRWTGWCRLQTVKKGNAGAWISGIDLFPPARMLHSLEIYEEPTLHLLSISRPEKPPAGQTVDL